MKNILVTGSQGQLGSEINAIESNYPDLNFSFTDMDELNICSMEQLISFFSSNQFDYIINCAAYTAVDKAETEQATAKKINIDGVNNLVSISEQYNISLIHISTDYVFDGFNYKPYVETDLTKSNSFYGYTKEEGEKRIINGSINAVIIRTSWLYSAFGNNFVKTISKHANAKSELNVVFDQIGTPTYAADLAKAIIQFIVQDKIKGIEIYHYSNEGVCSWYDFAQEIVAFQKIECKINPIEGKGYPAPANRPFYSVFNKEKIKRCLNIEIPYWKDSLKVCLSIINKK